ncbi:hypothetical protein TBLA_0G00740 [Henningerozyma blattae CBS 6284]|uniref:Uncharacterized protein n=1 Tax=Henningerozyma blattae (strain ATCC 34711 / CBS 6284 / DSM 70876 / NBRC 10599 / NRRL Y-10934 / UCD 77-7) TaxID=1071380 RepID=I2H6L9_HENB6|nr:hypothetical protein TBLA_0G00740 [Tetrapisispora blattae CBS 6284]CCH62021.1 hypothetical protein TBLA_0G00740 [Tetrapisispora blattae CBS 6284]
MCDNLPLCEQFFNIIGKDYEDNIEVRFSFSPDQQNVKDNIFISESKNLAEIICFKSTLAKLFIESHTFFEKYLKNNNELIGSLQCFYCTIGMLVTAPSHQTILNIHEKILRNLMVILPEQEKSILFQQEVNFCERILSSTSNRLNKSSIFWLYYKKLFIIYCHNFPHLDFSFARTIIKSAELHLSNYYCWNTARWYFDIVAIEGKTDLFNKALEYSISHVSDISSWDFLTYVTRQIYSTDKNISFFNESCRLQNNMNLSRNYFQFNFEKISAPNLGEISEKVFHLIDYCGISSLPPFLFLLNLNQLYNNIFTEKKKNSWKNDISIFEEKFGSITLGYIHQGSNTPLDPILSYSNVKYKKYILSKI